MAESHLLLWFAGGATAVAAATVFFLGRPARRTETATPEDEQPHVKESRLEDAMAVAREMALPAAVIVPQAGGKSRLGGLPDMPAEVDWPVREGRPLQFLLQLDLHELSAVAPTPWLPTAGSVLFFYDVESQPWGFAPDDQVGWRVIYVAPDQPTVRRRNTALAPLPERVVSLREHSSLPGWERLLPSGVTMIDEVLDAYLDAVDSDIQGPRHQVLGYPQAIQGDEMEVECQLASNGVDVGGLAGYASDAATRLRGGANEWSLLLQLDTDDELGLMWGDSGRIYFWIRRADAAARRFDRVWLVLQCY